MWIYEIKISFQFEIQKLHWINKLNVWPKTLSDQKKKTFRHWDCLVWILIKNGGFSWRSISKIACESKKSRKRLRSLLILNDMQNLKNSLLYICSNLHVLYLVNLSILPTKRRYWTMEYDKMLFVFRIKFS